MKRQYGMMIIFMTAALCLGQKHDSSDYIFDDTKIQKYDLSFYIENWVDSLESHKAVDEEYIAARFTWRSDKGDSVVLDSIGVRYKGNSSYNFAGSNPKKPFKFYFNKYRKGQKFFDVEKLNLSNMVHDPSCMREKISYDLCRRFMPVSRAVYAILSVQGKQIGLFLQLEEVDEGFLTRNFKDDQSNLYKSSDNGAYLTYKGAGYSDYYSEYDLRTNTNDNNWSGLIVMLNKLNNTSDTNFVKVMKTYLDLDNCIKYTAFNMVTSNFDSYTGSGRNIYLYDDQIAKQFKLIPWDFNLGMGNYTGGWDVIKVDAFEIPNLNQRPLSKRIMTIDSLKHAYGKYILSMIDDWMCPDTFTAFANRLKPLIDSAVKNDSNAFYDYETFLKGIDTDQKFPDPAGGNYYVYGITSFPKLRYAQLRAQIEREKIPVLDPLQRTNRRESLLQLNPGAGGKSIVVRYSLKSGVDKAALSIYNAGGRLVHSMVYGTKAPGSYTSIVDARSLPSGFYSVSIKTGKTNASAGMMLVKDK